MSYCEHVEVPDAVWETPSSRSSVTLGALSEAQPVLLIFLRHLGCTFCRQALADVRNCRAEIEGRGVQLALVHMVSDEMAASFFAAYGLSDLPRFSDPEKHVYRAFGLRRGGVSRLLGLSVWLKGFQSAVVEGHRPGTIQGDIAQLPGVFLVRNRRVISGYIHDTAADRPDYCRIAERGRG